MKPLVLFLAGAAICAAGATRTWVQNDYPDFEKGRLRGLSLRSDGQLSPGPRVKEVFDSASAYLWALARDSKGNIYAGGGQGAKLFLIAPDGTHKKIAEFDELEIHALAVDAQDRIYAATSPDGKVYRVPPSGKSEEFYNPKQKYIWGMAFGPQGDLFVATGDNGEIHRVDRSGKGSVFFKSDETHARSIAIDGSGNLVVGTDPGGLVIRVSPSGQGFVLYQMSKREITAIAIAPDGAVYAAGGGAAAAGPNILTTPLGIGVSKPGLEAPGAAAIRPLPAAGADVYRIPGEGSPQKIWANPLATVYAIVFDSKGRAVLSTGNKGTLYRVDSPELWTSLASVDSTQITALISGPDGALYGAGSNVGKVFRFGPDLEKQGEMESDVFDSSGFSRWGRIKTEGTGVISLSLRSGNTDRPRQNWSAWSPVDSERAVAPASRFAQWKAVLSADATLTSVELAYLPRNVAPRIEEIETTPPNYKFAAPAQSQAPAPLAATITLPEMGRKPAPVASVAGGDSSSMTLAKGWIGARWKASDENGDTLRYTVEIRGSAEKDWKPLARDIHEKHFSFDSTAFPDGEYRLRITASDAPSNVEAEALTAQETGAPFIIDNTPPEIPAFTAVRDSGSLRIRWRAADAWNVVKRAEYSLDGGDWTIADPAGKLSDSLKLSYELTLPRATPEEHTVAIRVTDEYDNTGVAKVVVSREGSPLPRPR